jgi:hypothetical protein
MPNLKKFRVNPYLFLLAKRLLAYEYIGMDDELPSALKFACFIYDRYKGKDYINTSFNSPIEERNTHAYSIANNLYDYFFKAKNFQFSEDKLNDFVSEIRIIRNYSKWQHFVDEFGKDDGAIVAADYFMGETWSKMLDKHQVKSDVNRRFYQLAHYHIRNAHHTKVLQIEDAESYIIRSATTEEIKEIEKLAKQIYPCPINDFDIKKPWHDKNPNIFFIYRDYSVLWANINLLPLKQYFYENLKSGKIYEDRISANDIYSLDERDQVEYIYIEGLACTVKSALPHFASQFDKMISSMANLEKNNVTICAIGGSTEGDQMMEHFGFMKTGTAIDPRTGDYPFYEIKWSDIKGKFYPWKDYHPSIVSKTRLTKLPGKK